ncbi:MAG: hypothetical protein QM630_06010 [Microbacterium sp.]
MTVLHKEIERFAEHQAALGKAIAAANQALQAAADSAAELPDAELTPQQQSTVALAQSTNSSVQVSAGVMMTPAQARQFYLDQAALAQEDAAAQVTATLDATLQEIMNSIPVSDYDEPEPSPESSWEDGAGRGSQASLPAANGRGIGAGVAGAAVAGGTGASGIGGSGTIEGSPGSRFPVSTYPTYPGPITGGIDEPRVDGGIAGSVPGGGVGGVPGGGVSGVLGGAAGSVGSGGLANRLGGLGGGASLFDGAGAAGSISGARADGVLAQPGGGNGARGGMMASGIAGTGTGAAANSKRNRRRGQDLSAFRVAPDDNDIEPDLGAAGAAGRTSSNGHEQIGW